MKTLIGLLGLHGDITTLGWLIEQAKNPEYESAVARAIIHMTGWRASDLLISVKQASEDDDFDDIDDLIFDHEAAKIMMKYLIDTSGLH